MRGGEVFHFVIVESRAAEWWSSDRDARMLSPLQLGRCGHARHGSAKIVLLGLAVELECQQCSTQPRSQDGFVVLARCYQQCGLLEFELDVDRLNALGSELAER